MFGNLWFNSNVENDDEYNEFLKEIMETNYSTFYRGTVVDNSDPMNSGRVRVRIPQIYGSEEQREQDIYVPTYAIPWATSAIMAGAGNNTGAYLIPNVGDTVFVTFENGDPKLPMYFGGIITRNGNNKFIGTDDANGGRLYKASDNDFNTDITNRSQRVLYKSIKGATILIDDKDGDESIKIIDQLGQFISLENVGGETLNRDRENSTDVNLARSGRIVIKDAYEDSIALHSGEIHIKAPKLIIETDDLQKYGFEDNDSYPDEVAKAYEILGETEDTPDPPPTPDYDYFYYSVYNDTGQAILVGVIFDSDALDNYQTRDSFDEAVLVLPGETWSTSRVRTDVSGNETSISILRYDMYARYNAFYSWDGGNTLALNASTVLGDGGRFYSKLRLEIDNADDDILQSLQDEGCLKLTNQATGETFYNYNNCVRDTGHTGHTCFFFGREFYFVEDRGGDYFFENFLPVTDMTLGIYDFDPDDPEMGAYCRVPIPNGTYQADVFSASEGDIINQSVYIYGGTENDWVGVINYNQSYFCRLNDSKLSYNTSDTVVVGPLYNTPDTETGGRPFSAYISSDTDTYGISFFGHIQTNDDTPIGFANVYIGIPGPSGELDDQFKCVAGCSFNGSNTAMRYQTMLGGSADLYQLPEDFFDTEYVWYITYRINYNE